VVLNPFFFAFLGGVLRAFCLGSERRERKQRRGSEPIAARGKLGGKAAADSRGERTGEKAGSRGGRQYGSREESQEGRRGVGEGRG
jgi:hypothetical protein